MDQTSTSPVGKKASDLGYVEETPTASSQTQRAQPPAPRIDASEFVQNAAGKRASDLGYKDVPIVSPGVDIAKSIVSGAQNIPIGAIGLPGTILGFAEAGRQKAIEKAEELGTRAYSYLRGESGTAEGDRRLEEMRARQKTGREIIERGPRLPTAYDIAEKIEPVAQAIGVPGPLYEPQTKAGKYGKTMIEFAGPGLLGKQKAVMTAVGALSGAASETAGQATEALGFSPEVQTAARVISGLATGVYAPRMLETGRNILAPTAKAERQIATQIASARAGGKAPSDADIQTALSELRQRAASGTATPGEQLVAYDLLGKRGAGVVERGAGTEGGANAARMIDEFIKERQAATTQRLTSAFDSIYGGKIQSDVARATMQRGIDIDNPALFTRAKSAPAAQNVQSSVTDAVKADPLAAPAINAAARTMRGAAPDNLTFWHEVKTNLDYMVDQAYKNNDTLLGKQLQAVRDSLRSDLKAKVPEYGQALDSASGFFKGKNAIDSGVNFAGKNYTMPELQDARRAYNNYGPAQKRQFEEAYLYQLRENAKTSTGPSVVSNLQGEYEKMAALFGRQKADRLYSVATAEDVINLKNAIDFTRPAGLPGMFSGMGKQSLGPTAGFGGISYFLMNPTVANLGTALVLGGTAARRLALNAEERAVVGQINKVLASNNPQQIERLSKMAAQNPNINSVLDKYKELMIRMLQVTPSASRTMESRQERKSGGRVMSAQHMLAAAERAKKDISGKTKVLLNSSDDHVAKALEIAKQNLEG